MYPPRHRGNKCQQYMVRSNNSTVHHIHGPRQQFHTIYMVRSNNSIPYTWSAATIPHHRAVPQTSSFGVVPSSFLERHVHSLAWTERVLEVGTRTRRRSFCFRRSRQITFFILIVNTSKNGREHIDGRLASVAIPRF